MMDKTRNKCQRGFTILEVLISVAILGVMGTGAAAVVSQTSRLGNNTSDSMTAIEQVENAAYWINHDALMAQVISLATGSGFPLVLSWQDIAGNTKQSTFNFSPSGSFQRTLVENGTQTKQNRIGTGISLDATKTNCAYSSGFLTFQATAIVGSSTEARSYQIKLRIDQPSSYLTITSTALAAGISNVAYNQALTVAGGTSPYVWTITAGTLPSGLSLSSGGVISGTPTVGQYFAAFNFTVQVTDSNNLTASNNLTIMINPLTINTTSLPDGKKSKGYGVTGGTPNSAVHVAVSGGTTIYTWSISAGSLPPGLLLNNTTGQISGTPDWTTGGNTYSFTVTITDSSGQMASKNLSIYVAN